jgi:3-methylcrotonyl-CoA carboxylase alpha subunit
MGFKLKLGDSVSEIELVARRPELACTVDGVVHRVSEAAAPSQQGTEVTVDGRRFRVWRVTENDRIHVKLGHRTFSVSYEDPITAAAHEATGADEIRADMPGVVIDVHRERGAAVAAGDPLLTIESMKMQITIAAPRNGTVGSVHVEPNASFQKGALLVSLEPEVE